MTSLTLESDILVLQVPGEADDLRGVQSSAATGLGFVQPDAFHNVENIGESNDEPGSREWHSL